MLKNENYINVSGWMLKELEGLRLNEIFIYAIIHGFCQDGKSFFTGSLSYLMEWTNSSKPTVIAALSKLVEKGFVIKKLVNGITPIYFTTRSRTEGLQNKTEGVKNFNRQLKNLTQGSKETLPPQLKNFTDTGKESLPNNTNNNLDNTSTSKKEVEKNNLEAAEEEGFILNKLKELFGSNVFDSKFIPELNNMFKQSSLDQERVGEYLDFVFKQTLEKKPNSVSNLFRAMAKAPNVLQDFIFQHPKKEKRVVETVTCPVCGNEIAKNSDSCPHCHFYMKNKDDEAEVRLSKEIYKLPQEQRDALDKEIAALMFEDMGRQLRDANYRQQQRDKINAVYKKYGINAKEA